MSEQPSNGCVYIATNIVNGKQYVGKTCKPIKRRMIEHKIQARNKATRSVFHSAVRKYGFEAFVWEIVFQSASQEELSIVEMNYIGRLKSKLPNGYNMTDGGEGRFGYKLSDDAKRRISEAMTGNTIWLGRKLTPEHKKNLSLANIGKNKGNCHTEEAKRKIGEASKGNPWRFQPGHKDSEETRKKKSESGKKKVFTEEHKANLKKNHSRPLLGRKMSEETKRKMSEAHFKRQAKIREQQKVQL